MLAGYACNFGYLNGFGLDPDELTLSFYDSVSGAFGMGILLLTGVIKHINWIVGIVIAIGCLFIFIIVLAIIISKFKWEGKILALGDRDKK